MSDSKREVAVCIDGSEHSRRAMEYYAKMLALPGRDRLHLVSIVDPPDYNAGTGFGGGHNEKKYQQAWERKLKVAEELQVKVTDSWVPQLFPSDKPELQFHQRMSSDAGEAICQIAQEANVNLIVMGSRGLGSLRRTFMGSVSDYVLHHSQRPIAIVPPPK